MEEIRLALDVNEAFSATDPNGATTRTIKALALLAANEQSASDQSQIHKLPTQCASHEDQVQTTPSDFAAKMDVAVTK